MSGRPGRDETEIRRLVAAVGAASLAAALAEALVALARTPRHFELGEALAGSALGASVASGAFIALGVGAAFLVAVALGPARLLEVAGRPWREVGRLFAARETDERRAEGFAAFFGVLLGQALFFGVTAAGAAQVFRAFHERLRMALLIGAIAVLAAFLGRAASRLLVACVFGPLFRAPGPAGARRQKAAVACLAVAALAALAAAVANVEDLFGAVDPFPFAVPLLFFLSFSVAAAVAERIASLAPRPLAALVVGLALLAGSAAVMGKADGLRSAVSRYGAVSAALYQGMIRVLDLDRDGAAWLFGGDCHPLDPNAGPYADEVPGNGYDENCDGSDRAPTGATLGDPLDALGPAARDLVHRRGNILFVIVDATSARRLSSYGSKRNVMPGLERFAKRATVFKSFFAVANHTSVAMPSLLAGVFPSAFAGIESRGWHSFAIPAKANPLQQRLELLGYETIMHQGHQLGGFLAGFDYVTSSDKRATAGVLGQAALKQLKQMGPTPVKPVFFGIHFIDPHHPYQAPEKPDRYGKRSIDRYDAEISYVDGKLKPILDLVQGEEWKDWLVIVTADHGEAFHEHGTPHHGYSLYDEETHVPLVMRIPGVTTRRVGVAASQIDILPTILEWIGQTRDPRLPGRSLLATASAAGAKRDIERIVFAEFFRNGRHFAATDGRYHALYSEREGRTELYDMVRDPQEQRDVFGKVRADALEAALKRHVRESHTRLANPPF